MGTILIEDLSVRVSVGVTDRERSKKQTLLVSVEMRTEASPGTIGDSLDRTIDYSKVRGAIKSLLERGRYNLIETVAEKTAHEVKSRFHAGGVRVTVKKFPYRDVRHVSYTTEL